MFDRTTDAVRRVWELAQHEARRLHHNYVGTEHLLVGLLAETDGVAGRVLRSSGATVDGARSQLDRLVDEAVLPGPRPTDAEVLDSVGIDLDQVRWRVEQAFGPAALDRAARRVSRGGWRRGAAWTPLCGFAVAPRTKRVMELARNEADALGSPLVDTEHVLLGVIDDALTPFRNRLDRRNKRIVALRGLPAQHSSGARMVLEAVGMDLESLRASVLSATRTGR